MENHCVFPHDYLLSLISGVQKLPFFRSVRRIVFEVLRPLNGEFIGMGMDVFGYAWWRPKQLQRWRSVSTPTAAAAVAVAVAYCNLQHATDPTAAAE